jgi:hypothetical protein
MRRRLLLPAASAVGVLVFAAPGGGVSATAATISHRPIAVVGANHSSNWSGYNQGYQEKGVMFHSISGQWVVPHASAHNPGEAEYSSSWVGIGGGCVDAQCQVTDSTLIQAGTEQDVDSSGNATYSAWWEIIPQPSTPITTITVHPGDRMSVAISETAANSEMWTITVKDLTDKQTFTVSTPYPSTYATAEWIEETPVVITSGGGTQIGPLPSLTKVHFDKATTNGSNPKLVASEELQLVPSGTTPVAIPSAPERDTDGFNDCVFASTCPTPRS